MADIIPLVVRDGTPGGDRLIGTSDDDTLRGLGGDDQIFGGAGDDLLQGGTGNDTITTDGSVPATGEDDTVEGGDGDDFIIVGASTDTGRISGDAGDDTIRILTRFFGALEGGEGFDTVSLQGGRTNITGADISGMERLRLQNASVELTEVELAAFAEVLVEDRVTFTPTADGAFRLANLTVADNALLIVEGSDGGTEFSFPGDASFGQGASFAFDGGDGDDTVAGSGRDDRLDGNDGNDRIDGEGGDDVIAGGAGNDTLIGGAGDDTIETGTSSPFVTGSDTVRAGGGDDTIIVSPSTTDGLMSGEAGNDNFRVTGVFGGTLDGGTGEDVIQVDSTSADLSGATFFNMERLELSQGTLRIDPTALSALPDVQLTGATTITLSAAGAATLRIAGHDGGALAVRADDGGSQLTLEAPAGLPVVTFRGGRGDDRINTMGGDDSLDGGEGSDTLIGGAGNDTLNANAFVTRRDGIDVLDGGAGDDVLVGGLLEADRLTGGTGADLFIVSDGNVITDLEESDVITVSARLTSVAVTATIDGQDALLAIDYFADGGAETTVRVVGGANLQFVSELNEGELTIQAVAGGSGPGTPGDDDGISNPAILGTGADDTLDGLAGNDLVRGFGGDDLLIGGEGRDTLQGGIGTDTLRGDAGDDLLRSGQNTDGRTIERDLLDGGAGDDTLVAERGSGGATLQGGAGDDELRLNVPVAFTGTVNGGAGSDTLILGGASADLTGATITGIEQTVLGVQPITVTRAQIADLGAISVAGSAGALRLGDQGAIRFNNVDLGEGQELRIFGHENGTELSFRVPARVDGPVVFRATGGDNRVSGGSGDDSLFGAGGNDTVLGNDGNNALGGGDGHDSITGGAGNDTLYGGRGSDTVDGGLGDDVILIGEGTDLITDMSGDNQVFAFVTSYGGFNQIVLGSGDDLVSLTHSRSTGTDHIRTGDGDDSIWADRGNDRVNGEGGNDLIAGGEGDDILLGGAGRDTIYGGDGNDTINGGEGSDVLFGGEGDDTFLNVRGDDIVIGGGGFDRVTTTGSGSVLFLSDDQLTITQAQLLSMRLIGWDTRMIEAVLDVVPTPVTNGELAAASDVSTQNFGFDGMELDGVRVDRLGEDLEYNGLFITKFPNGKMNVASQTGAAGQTWVEGSNQDDEIDVFLSENVELDGGAGDDILRSFADNTTLTGGQGDDVFWVLNGPDINEVVITDYEANETIVIPDDAVVQTLPDDGNGPRFSIRDSEGNETVVRLDESVNPDDVFFQSESEYERVRKVTDPVPEPDGPDLPPDGDDPFPPGDGDPDNPPGLGDTPPPPPPVGPEGDIFGQPGLITLDGAFLDFQAVGEFTLVRSTNPGQPLDVQIRTEASGAATSLITAAAINLDGRNVVVDANGDALVTVDGVPQTFEGGLSALVGDGEIYAQDGKITIVLPSGELIMIGVGDGRLDVCVFLDNTRAGAVEGLMGNADGDSANDLAFPLADGGAVLSQPVDFGTLYGAFADAWRLTDQNSRFDYAPGEGTEDFQDRAFPPFVIALADLPDEVVNAAREVVNAAGIADPILRDAAILDVALTGDVSFIQTALNLAADPDTVVAFDPATLPPAPNLVGVGALDPVVTEGTGGTTTISFVVYRTGDVIGALTVDWAVLPGGVFANDFVGGALPEGAVRFGAGEREAVVELALRADARPEGDETLTLRLDPRGNAAAIKDTVQIVVVDDDPDGHYSLAGTTSHNVVEIWGAGNALRVTEGQRTGDTEEAVRHVTGSALNDRIMMRQDAALSLRAETGYGHDEVQTGAGGDHVDGGAGDDTIRAGGGADRADGGSGNDVVNGQAGADTVDGGGGDDTVHGGNGSDSVSGGMGDDTISGGNQNDTVDGGAGSDLARGDEGDDLLRGSFGHDTLQGGTGRDTLYGQTGDDALRGGDGNDLLDGGEGDDTLSGNGFNDTLRAGDGDDVLRGDDGQDHLFGGRGKDVLNGGAGADSLDGGRGADVLRGGEDEDTLRGDDGGDLLRGGAANDTLSGGEGDDTVDGGSGADRLFGDGGTDTLFGRDGDDAARGGTGDDELYGNAGRDWLHGDAGNDSLFGGVGDDTLRGGTGDDQLVGEAGADTFIVTTGDGADRVIGFTLGEDTLRFIGLNAGDLTITQRGANTLIDYGDPADSITLVDVLASRSDLFSDIVFV